MSHIHHVMALGTTYWLRQKYNNNFGNKTYRVNQKFIIYMFCDEMSCKYYDNLFDAYQKFYFMECS